MNDVYYERAGCGTSRILLIHGWASSLRLYDHLVEEFAHEADFWRLDLPGHGKTPPLDNPATIPDYVRVLEAFCDAHALRPNIVLGHSMGGLLTLKLAQRRPDLMQRLVLICPVVTGEFGAWRMGSQLVRTSVGKLVLQNSRQVWELLQQPFVQSIIPDALIPTSKWVIERVVQDFQATDWATGIQLLMSMTEESMQPYLPSIVHPTLVMVGTQDVTVPPSEGRYAAQQMPNARLVLFTQSMHLPFEEEPQKAWDTLRAFFFDSVPS